MSKTPFLPNKETLAGIGLLSGVVMLFFVNAIVVVISLINVYGAKKVVKSKSAIDDTVISQAVSALEENSQE